MKDFSNVLVIIIRIIIYYDADISFFKSITYTVVCFCSHAVVHMGVAARWSGEGAVCRLGQQCQRGGNLGIKMNT